MPKRLHLATIPFSLGAVLAIWLAHLGFIVFDAPAVVPSNVMQLISAAFAAAFCAHRAWSSPEKYFQSMWLQICAAFGLWALAQGIFTVLLLDQHRRPSFPDIPDLLWLFFALPILTVTVTRRTGTRWEWINWLDFAQACIFFCLLDGLAFSHTTLLSVKTAYDVQAVAMFLTAVLRFSGTPPGPDRRFFRTLTLYLAVYSLLTGIGFQLESYGSASKGLVGLCWDTPFLAFCALTCLSERKTPSLARPGFQFNMPRHFQGLSALGLAVLSISAGGVLETRHPVGGSFVMAMAFLLFAIRTSARELQLFTAHDDLQHSVQHDSLTGLGNRALLMKELAMRLGGDSAMVSRTALFYIDLDRFKTINDGLGHQFGNDLLIAVGQILRSTANKFGDLAVRLGGDKFVVFTDCASESEARDRAQAYLDRLRKPLSLDGRVLHLTASTGIALARPGMVPDELLRNSDCAMYVAKANGRNQAKLFEISMIQRATDELWLETDLREALHSGGVSVDYQPIYSLTGRAIVGFEALARWRHPTRGMISPALFIPVAEETGLVLELGRQVLREACRQMAEWNRLFSRDFHVSVNVSARQFAGSSLLPNVCSILEETGFHADRLKLEITESVLISGVQTVEDVLTAARRLGIEISLDDFGTGYSSLSYLLRFPFDVVKIDRSFVQALDRDPQRANLAEMIVQLAIRLGKKVVAEGVETVEERNLLERMHCDLLQGYLFSKPLAPAIVEDLLRQHSGSTAWLQADASQIWSPSKRAGVPKQAGGAQEEASVWDGHETAAYLHG